MTAQEIRGPNFVLCLILVVCSLALVTGTDSGGLCLMMAQDACVVVSSQLTKAGIDRNYAEACRLVERYDNCIKDKVTTQLQCSMTSTEQSLHSKNIQGYNNAPYNCRVTASGMVAASLVDRNLAYSIKEKPSTVTYLLKIFTTILIATFLYCITN